MGYNLRDISRTGKILKESMDERSEKQAKRLASEVTKAASEGRGLWVFILWPTALFMFLVCSSLLESYIVKLGFSHPWDWMGLLVGGIVVCGWYGSSFTRNNPLLSSIIWGGATALAGRLFERFILNA